jgi:CO/xanthine dehydrogenase Mo-binding subunit
MRTIGESVVRKDAHGKTTGEVRYTSDVQPGELLSGLILRSSQHHAMILSIDTTHAKKMPGVRAILTAADIPGKKTFGNIVDDRPVLAIDRVRHLGEPVALIVADTERQGIEAMQSILVEYEPLPAVFSTRAALQPEAPSIHPDGNLFQQLDVSDGDIELGFEAADIIVEETFRVHRVSPAYLETEAAAAQWNDDETISVWLSSQDLYKERREIGEALGLNPESLKVQITAVGGGFGGKEDASIGILATLGAMVTKAGVHVINDRSASFLSHPKRHPAVITCRLGSKKDGTLLALDARIEMDTGAYLNLGPAVACLVTEVMPGAYLIPNVKVETKLIYTNSPPSGAMRGFGNPQAHFAIESMIDMLAEKLQMDATEFRKRNVLRPGDYRFTRVRMDGSAESAHLCLEEAEIVRSRFSQKQASPGKKSGVGLAMFLHFAGLGYGVPDDSTTRLDWLPSGNISIALGSPDIGQGLSSVIEQITAEALGLPYEHVIATTPDSQITPDSGDVCASRMTYLIGNSVLLAVEKLKQSLLDFAAKSLNMDADKIQYQEGNIVLANGELIPAAEISARALDDDCPLSAEATFSFPYPQDEMPQHLPFGIPHSKYIYGAQVARVEIDTALGLVEVTDFASVHDVGRILNRRGIEAQVEGSVAMGIGYTLHENVELKRDGKWVDTFAEYLMPTVGDVPGNVESILLEIPDETGPFGAKGMAEAGLVGVAPAITNAIHDAIGVRVTRLPVKPEMLLNS